jgi:hypothetical protein
MMSVHDAHPFLVWFAYLNKRRFAVNKGTDLILNRDGAKRFAVGVETAKDAGSPVLGVNVHDAKAIRSIDWSAAAIVAGHDNQDWFALAAKDIRPSHSSRPNPAPLRLWIPVPMSALDAFVETNPRKINLKRVQNGKGGTPVFEKAPFLSLALSIKDKWSEVEA